MTDFLSTEFMYIFLDMDGVLNSRKWRISQGLAKTWKPGEHRDISEEMLLILKDIIGQCPIECRIIFTSQGRIGMDEDEYGDYIRGMFNKHGLEIFDVTPNIDANRTNEIRAYLNTHFANPNAVKFVIIDDEPIYDYYEHQIKTSYETGLTISHINEMTNLMVKIYYGGNHNEHRDNKVERCRRHSQRS